MAAGPTAEPDLQSAPWRHPPGRRRRARGRLPRYPGFRPERCVQARFLAPSSQSETPGADCARRAQRRLYPAPPGETRCFRRIPRATRASRNMRSDVADVDRMPGAPPVPLRNLARSRFRSGAFWRFLALRDDWFRRECLAADFGLIVRRPPPCVAALRRHLARAPPCEPHRRVRKLK